VNYSTTTETKIVKMHSKQKLSFGFGNNCEIRRLFVICNLAGGGRWGRSGDCNIKKLGMLVRKFNLNP